MPDDNKKMIKQFLAAIKTGDGETMLGLLADDAVVVLPGSFKVAWAGRWEGKEPIKQCFRAIGDLLEIRDHTVKLMVAEGESVFVLIDETSASKNTGRILHQETVWYFRITGGTIRHWQAFEDSEQIAWAWDDGR
jgi:ketosteroid isomerase-like protein